MVLYGVAETNVGGGKEDWLGWFGNLRARMIRRRKHNGCLIDMEQYPVFLIAPENLSLMAEEDKDIWEVIKAQCFLEELYAGKNSALNRVMFSLEKFSYIFSSGNLQLLWPETSLPSLKGCPRISFQSNREYQNQLCSSADYAVYNRAYTADDRNQSCSGTVRHLFYWLFLSSAIRFWSPQETRSNHYGWCYIIISSCDSGNMSANSVLNLSQRLFTDLACLG